MDLESPDLARFADFMDDRVIRFTTDQLRVPGSDSPNLTNQHVTDPFCGTSLRGTERAIFERGSGACHFFYTEASREVFSEEPGRCLNR